MPNETAETPCPYQLIGPSEDGLTTDLLAEKPATEGRQRLQALITQWLRMENLVVLTGAGTSISSGGKTVSELEEAVLGTVNVIPGTPDSIQALVSERLTPSTAGPALGFEDWLSYLVNGHYIASASHSPFAGVSWPAGRAAPTHTELAWFIKRVKASIFAECALTLPDDGSTAATGATIAPHLPFLAKLVARDSNLGRTHLFTLNYDTLVEQACERLGIQYFDGFTGRADARFDPSVYGLDIYYPGDVSEGRVRRFDKFLHLYKLHGSLHWAIHGDALRARHPDLRRFLGYADLAPETKAQTLTKLAEHTERMGILPTANKFVQTLTMPFSHLFRALQIRLSTPQTFLLVLGYSFGDAHVTRMLETALMNPSLVMLVVEPDPQSHVIERVRRYRSLGHRAFVLSATKSAHTQSEFVYATFDDFARRIMPDVQWLNDFLRLRRVEKEIRTSGLGADAEATETPLG